VISCNDVFTIDPIPLRKGTLALVKRLLTWILVSLLAGLAVAAQASELVREFSGSRSAETGEFEVEAPWLIDWRVNSDFPQAMGIAIALINARDGSHVGRVVKTKTRGNGVRLMNESGLFRFKVDASVANWTLKVEQLTREEAELYTPVETDQQ
jgi:hypothetical protein